MCVCVCVGSSAHCIQYVGIACLCQRGNLAEHRLLYEPQDAGREVNISATILRRWSVEVPRTSEESVRYCNLSCWQEDNNRDTVYSGCLGDGGDKL